MEKYFRENQEFEKRWLGVDGYDPLPASERRIAVTKWAAQAWETTCMSMDFGGIGFSTGCNMTLNDKYKVGNEVMDVPKIKIEGVPDYSFDDVVIENYPEHSEDEAEESEVDENPSRDDSLEFCDVEDDCDDGGADEEYDDTAEFEDVGLPPASILEDIDVQPEFLGLDDLNGKLILFKLDAKGTPRKPGWYQGRVDKKKVSAREAAQGYNFNLKFTKRSTAENPTPFSGSIAVLLNEETYGLNNQYVLYKAK